MKCNKMVDRITVNNLQNESVIYIHAHCHGETDTMTLTYSWINANRDFMFAIENDMTMGEAFKEAPANDVVEVA